MSGYAQSEDYSSIISSRHEMEEVLARPFASDHHGYDYQRSSYSESSYSRHEDEPELQQTMDILPLSQGLAPSSANMPSPGRNLSLPQMPNVFSDHETMSQVSRVSRTEVVSDTRVLNERRESSANTRHISKGMTLNNLVSVSLSQKARALKAQKQKIKSKPSFFHIREKKEG